MRYDQIIIFLIVSLFTSPHTSAEIKITLASDPWAPYIFGETDGIVKGGVLVELYDQIFSKIDGVDVQYELLPWKRALLEVEEGRVDGVMALLKSKERALVMDFTEPVFEGKTVFWYVKSFHPKGIKWRKLTDLLPYQIGVVAGYETTKVFSKGEIKGIKFNINEMIHEQQIYKMLLLNRLDIMPNNEISANYTFRQNGGRINLLPWTSP